MAPRLERVAVDGDVALLELNVRAKKGATWVSEIGLTIKDIQVSVSVHRDAILESICPKSIGDSTHDSACFMGGSIEVCTRHGLLSLFLCLLIDGFDNYASR